MLRLFLTCLLCSLMFVGCAAPKGVRLAQSTSATAASQSSDQTSEPDVATALIKPQQAAAAVRPDIQLVAAETDVEDSSAGQPEESLPTAELSAETTPTVTGPLTLGTVIVSVRSSYPLLRAAVQARTIAQGQHLAAHGAFDTKLKAASENGVLGFYENYRQSVGFEQPTMWGGSVVGGYRLGRGDIQPWYQERLTDEGGEFKAGVSVPLLQNKAIDPRRAELWKTSVDVAQAEPEIRQQEIQFVWAASYAYWNWVAAGRRVAVAESLLKMANDRNDLIRRKVDVGDTDPPVLQDNQRLIVSREAKLIDEQRKLQQSAVKLSLFLRDTNGNPVIPEASELPGFPEPQSEEPDLDTADFQIALAQRPDLPVLDLQQQQLQIDRQQAGNELLPDVRAAVLTGKDVGEHATSKRDKRPFEMEASLYVDVPLQRRKARGKLLALDGKLSQLMAKRRMTSDKISSEVRIAHAGLEASWQKLQRARESVKLAGRMTDVEQRRFDLGESDLLSVNLREQQSAEALLSEVEALLEYYTSLADLDAAMGNDPLAADPDFAP